MEPMGGTAPDLMTAAFLSMQPPSTVVAFARFVVVSLFATLARAGQAVGQRDTIAHVRSQARQKSTASLEYMRETGMPHLWVAELSE